MSLTSRQQELLDFIHDYQMSNGSSPTLKEMRVFLKVNSDNSVLKHLKALEKKGVLTRSKRARGVNLLADIKERMEKPDIKLPMYGSVPAGAATLEEQVPDTWISVAENLVQHPTQSYLLKVRGDSMLNAGIMPGDTVIVHYGAKARNGDIVVALIDGESTIKRLIMEGGYAYLKAENPQYQDLHPVSELSIQGIVTALIRNY
ncbi:MAG: repressor LexA [Candidatus Abawacabacteria bacterium RBG_16_42_10]|uniref:Repressor LexA n=1 Tax=Candidatus Abawacabacteria bacterium RBG_16_42_10 TaxID=1817814 RepID=A0A1F4XLG6_9BACT|nr:MAG: repressor LexA [Candidatus Abawacabacteria bacterium RBG_16_42_10]